jgi:hypothetical protein
MFKNNCINLNHGRVGVPVRFCPMCGEVVNGTISSMRCDEAEHATMRRKMNKYCVDCGEQLIKSAWE